MRLGLRLVRPNEWDYIQNKKSQQSTHLKMFNYFFFNTAERIPLTGLLNSQTHTHSHSCQLEPQHTFFRYDLHIVGSSRSLHSIYSIEPCKYVFLLTIVRCLDPPDRQSAIHVSFASSHCLGYYFRRWIGPGDHSSP